VTGVDLDLEAGDCLLIVGPSGSGKSTLGLALAGLIPRELSGAWRGSLTVDGVETRSFEPGVLAARVGLVFQDPSRQIVMDRVGDDTAFGLENRAWPRPDMIARVPDALDVVGLSGTERRYTRTLSGGQQQRLALAGVLAPRPGILVLDEPTANLDPLGVAAFDSRLAMIRSQRSATTVLIEHRASVAWPLADVVLMLGRDGAPIAVGPPDQVLARYRDRAVAEGIWLPDEPVVPLDGRDRGPRPGAVRPVVVASGLRFGYDRRVPVIRDIDLTVGRAERVALVGANGSGKSTLARLLVGLLRPDLGSVRLLGVDPIRLAPAELAAQVGFVFQRPERQFLATTVSDEIRLGLPSGRTADVDIFMDRIGLPLAVFGDRSPYRLSGGEQRRLSLATALVRRPGLLILDEPTFGQDHLGFDVLVEILREQVDGGTSVVMATHDERLVATVASRVIRLEAGRLADPAP
jgi:energy-coupling factor transport system ATP-binding protein